MMLRSLEIKNFRSLTNFNVPRLGRVNLIVGRNNSGKSSVLEALHIYAANGQRDVLDQIAAGHDEKFRVHESEPDDRFPYEDFFAGRHFPEEEEGAISIGEIDAGDSALTIQHVLLMEIEESVTDEDGEITKRTRRRPIPKGQSNFDFGGAPVSQAISISKHGRSYFLLIRQFTGIDRQLKCPRKFLSAMYPPSLSQRMSLLLNGISSYFPNMLSP